MPGIPICVFVPSLAMFRVVVKKGKAFTSGGFGVAVPPANDCLTREPRQKGSVSRNESTTTRMAGAEAIGCTTETEKAIDNVPRDHLFPEEALYLHERGLLQVLHDGAEKKMTTQELVALLEVSAVPLASYLTYSHLRQQTFIVVRHRCCGDHEVCYGEPNCENEDNGAPDESNQDDISRGKAGITSSSKKRKLYHRLTLAAAPPPRMIRGANENRENKSSSTASNASYLHVSFDVYGPNSNFRKTNPGPPHFCVAVSSFHEPSISFDDLKNLLNLCHGIPLRIAAVSDSGSVVMFRLSGEALPIRLGATEHGTSEDPVSS